MPLYGFQSILIHTDEIANDAITTEKIKDFAITTSKIANNAVTTEKIVNNAVTTEKLANNAITTNKIADNAITTNKIANNAITTEKLADNSITTSKIVNYAITTNKIADNSITTSKIVNNAVTTEKIANSSITTDKIADNSITTSKIVNYAVTTDKIADNSITTEKFHPSAIAPNSDKLDGYDASLTPAPNVIVPLNAEGILDLSATYVKSNVYTFRRVNLTGATSDYELKVGEEAYIGFSNTTIVPLRIAVPSNTCFYQILAVITDISADNLDYMLLPNNTTYSGQFSCWFITLSGSGNSLRDAFFHDLKSGSGDVSPYILMQFVSIRTRSSFVIGGGGNTVSISNSGWANTTTPWTSLGSIKSYNNQTLSGYILIRRLR